MEILSRVYRIIKANIIFILGDRVDKNNEFHNENETKRKFHTKTGINIDNNLAQYYVNLEIPYGSNIQTTKKAWKNMMKKYHPDLHARSPEKKETANTLTRELTKAYNEIKKAMKQKPF